MQALDAIGVSVHGIADGTPYEAHLPGCRSVLVFGNAGSALWTSFVVALRDDPTLATANHPLDTFVARTIAALPEVPGRRWIRCAADETTFLDFRTLAMQAGLGLPGRLGLLMHPRFGPWLGLRAACLSTEALPFTGPLPGPVACAACPAPCVTACPVGAVGDQGVDWRRSQAFQQTDPTCHGGCLARAACPEGAAHAYGPLQHRYHQHGAGRRAVLEELLRSPRDTTQGGHTGGA